jgi:hypothetical protein
MNCKCATVQSSCWIVQRYRGKRTQPKNLGGASVRDRALYLLQGAEVGNLFVVYIFIVYVSLRDDGR